MNDLPDDIRSHIQSLVDAYGDIQSIWLIGSRTNNNARPDSDWDFLVFTTPSVLLGLRSSRSFFRPDVDLLIVTDQDHFESPWPRDDKPSVYKRGRLRTHTTENGIECVGWEWTGYDDNTAGYTTSFTFKRLRAIKVFDRITDT